MCWKYEDEYGECFDHLMFDADFFVTDIPTLLKEYSVNIVDKDRFREMLYKFLEEAHENKVIMPIPELRKDNDD